MTRRDLLKRLPLIGDLLPPTGEDSGRYSSRFYRTNRITWRRRGVRKIRNFVPRSIFQTEEHWIGDGKFSDTVSVHVEAYLLDSRGRKLRKVKGVSLERLNNGSLRRVEGFGESVKKALRLIQSKKPSFLLIITEKGKQRYSPSHDFWTLRYSLDIYPF